MRCSPLVLGVDVGAVVQQVLHHRHAVVAGGKVERRGVPPLQVPAVHVLRCAQLLPCTETHRMINTHPLIRIFWSGVRDKLI